MPATDEQLSLRVFGGDEDAFAELYERYYQRIHDFVARMVQDADVADDLVQSTFVKAWENLQKRRVTGNVKAWLYTIARNNAINELKRRKWVARSSEEDDEGGGPFPFTVVDPSRLSDPQGVIEDEELVDLVWRSATALNHREFALLDLHLRKGLNPQELASAFGVRRNNMNTMLYRLRHSLEESVVATLLVRRGRGDCPDLDALVADLPADETNPETRRAVARHLETCDRCQESKKRYASPVEIFSGLALLPVSAGQLAASWQAVKAKVGSAAGGGSSLLQAANQPLRWWAQATATVKAMAVAAAVTAVGVPLALTMTLAGGGEANPASAPLPTSQVEGVAVAGAESAPTPGVKVVAVRVEPPARASPGEAFDVFASAGLLNGGPAETVFVDTTFSLAAPAGCTVSPGAPVTHQDTSLPREIDVSITRGWEVTCAGAGGREFRVEVSVAIDPSESVTDPDLGDNTNSGTASVAILGR